MRWFRFLVLASLAALAQTTVVRVVTVRGTRPDLLITVLVAFSLGVRRSEAFAVGCVTGFLRDLFTLEPLGLSTGSFALLGYLVARGRAGVFADRALTHGVVAALCSAASSGVSWAAVAAAARGPSVAAGLERVAGTALLTAVLSGLVGPRVWRRRRWFGLRRALEFEHV